MQRIVCDSQRGTKGEPKLIEVYLKERENNNVKFLQYSKRGEIEGDILVETNSKGFIEKIEVCGKDIIASILQCGQ